MATMVTGEDTSMEEMGGAEMHCAVSGLGDLLAANEAEVLEACRRYLSYMPARWDEWPALATPAAPELDPRNLVDVIPEQEAKPFDMWGVIRSLVDGGSIFEFKALYAKEIITCFARLNGRPVGVVANQSLVKGGALFPESSEKAAHFVNICNAYNLPLLFLMDVPGWRRWRARRCPASQSSCVRPMAPAIWPCQVPPWCPPRRSTPCTSTRYRSCRARSVMSLQAKLLRVLQDGEFERVGGTRPMRVDVRIIAATNKDLEALVAAGEFRADLYYRLNVLAVQIPPLHQRPEDIPTLVQAFIAKFNRELGTAVEGVTPAALHLLLTHDWPGNVRELENVLRRAMYLVDGARIDVDHLPPALARRTPEPVAAAAPPATTPPGTTFAAGREAAEQELILRTLEATGGNRKRAAEMLGIGRTTLYEKLERLGLPTRKR